MIKAKAIWVIIVCISFFVVLGCTSEAKDKIDKNIVASASFYKAQNYEKAVESGKKAVKSSPKNCYSHYWLGSAYGEIGELKLAIEELKKAEALAINKSDMAFIANKLGLSYLDFGNIDEALRQHNRALIIARELGDNDDIAANLANMATVFSAGGQKEKALEYFQDALKLQPDGPGTSSIYGNIADIYIEQNKINDAELFVRKAIDLCERTGNYQNQAIQFIRLGDILRLKKDYKAAEGALLDGLKKIQKVGDLGWEGNACEKLGWLYEDLGKNAQAAEYYKKELAIYTQLGIKQGIEAAQRNLDKISKAN